MDPTLAKIVVDQYMSPCVTSWSELEPVGAMPVIVGLFIVVADVAIHAALDVTARIAVQTVVMQRQCTNPLSGGS